MERLGLRAGGSDSLHTVCHQEQVRMFWGELGARATSLGSDKRRASNQMQ